SSPDGVARDAAGASDISNEELALFVQDKWRIGHGVTVDYGFRWDAQRMPETVDPKTTAYASFLNDPRFPSDGTIPDQWQHLQPQSWFRPRAGTEHGGVRRFHSSEGGASHTLPELQRARYGGGGGPAPDARRDDVCRRQPVRAAVERRLRHQQPRPGSVPWRH